MLQINTKAQLEKIAEILGGELEEGTIRDLSSDAKLLPIYAVQSEKSITFDQMKQIVEYLEQTNET